MKVEVQCSAGWAPDEKPVRFRLDGHDYAIDEVIDQWYGPDH